MLRLPALLCACLLTAGCGLVYKVDVYQGSLLTPESVEQLQAGMSKRQVQALIGSPSVADTFHQSRWDYIASTRLRGGETEVKNLVLHFDGDTLQRWEGDYFPEQDMALLQNVRKYGNLPRDKDKKRGR